MKIPKFTLAVFSRPKKKLRASTARRFAGNDDADFEEMAEPNMKLSRALLIVLILHVVAVAGIIAFNTIKSRQGAFPPAAVAASTPAAKTDSTPAGAVAASAAKGEEESAIPRALPVANESANTYTVAKGDNPVKIAKKLKVSESELLSVNHIDDPRKLQIGQKLIIPAKAKAKK